MKKIVLGTAQLGMNYGVSNVDGKVKLGEARQILSYAKISGISRVDTAISYGDSQGILGKCNAIDFEITTKLPQVPEGCRDVDGWILSTIYKAIHQLGVSRLDVVLLHHPTQILSSEGNKIIDSINKLKTLNLTKKIGISIYDDSKLELMIQANDWDVVQGPLNIFDTRLLRDGWIERLTQKNIIFEARSIFLQGLLLMQAHLRPKYFTRWNTVFSIWERWLKDNNVNALQASLGFINSIPNIDSILVGVHNINQLKDILESNKNFSIGRPNFIDDLEIELLDPRLWKIS